MLKCLGKNNSIITEHEEITCISDLMSELNYNTHDGERKRVDFKHKLDTIINNKPVYNEKDMLNIHEVVTQECKDIFCKLGENDLRKKLKVWCDEKIIYKRKCMTMCLSNLKTVCKLKGMCTADLNRNGKDDLIKLIINELKRDNAGDQKEQSCTEVFQLKMLHVTMTASYSKPISNQRSEGEHTKLGHINEKN